MIPPMLRLPTLELDREGFGALVELCAALAASWLVVVSRALDASQRGIDEFALASAVAAARDGVRLGVATSLGAARVPSLIAREATSAQLLGACDALVLEGEEAACVDAARIVAALFTPGRHSVATPTSAIAEAVNDPQPSVAGGPPIRFAAGRALRGLSDGAVADLGEVRVAWPDEPLPDAVPDTLVVLQGGPASPAALRARLRA